MVKGKQYKCTHCDNVYRTEKILKEHIRKKHIKFIPKEHVRPIKKVNPFEGVHIEKIPGYSRSCACCGKRFKGPKSYKNHIDYIERKKKNLKNIKNNLNEKKKKKDISYGVNSSDSNFNFIATANQNTYIYDDSEKRKAIRYINRMHNVISKRTELEWGLEDSSKINEEESFSAEEPLNEKESFNVEESFNEEESFNVETVSTGYGEVRPGSMIELFNFLMTIDSHLNKSNKTYNLTPKSFFLDIGSGFGKPVFHCAYQVGCVSWGIEAVLKRVRISLELKDNLNKYINKKISYEPQHELSTNEKCEITCVKHNPLFLDLCNFCKGDATKVLKYAVEIMKMIADKKIIKNKKINENDYQCFTHIYFYNKLSENSCITKICEILNNTNWKVLAWYKDKKTTSKCGLKNFEFVNTIRMSTTGNQCYSCYVYINTGAK